MYEESFDPEQALQYARELAKRAKQLQDEVAETEIDVASPDRSIKVTVTVPGKIANLTLDQSLLQGANAKKVGEAILASIQAAQKAAEHAAEELVNRHLPNMPNFSEVVRPLGEEEFNR